MTSWAQDASDALDALGDTPTPDQARRVTDRFEDTDVMAALAARGGGGTFNGGTITEPLTIDLSDADPGVQGFHVVLPNDFDFSVKAFSIEIDGQFSLLEYTTGGAVSTAGNPLITAGGEISTDSGTITTESENGVRVVAANGNTVLNAITTYGVLAAVHDAPADNLLVAGHAAIWFDQTNGAGKLMIKAKTANGTVVTGQVALT